MTDPKLVCGRRRLLEAEGLALDLATFSPGQRQSRHHDAHSRVTLVLRGRFHEEADAGSQVFAPTDLLFKSRAAAHEDRYSPEGATLASLVFLRDEPFHDASLKAWLPSRESRALNAMLDALEAALAGDGAGMRAAASDTLLSPSLPARRSRPPCWLVRLRDDLRVAGIASIDLNSRAREAGVHPDHVSRLFRRCFGASLTEHARGESVRRALHLLARPGATLGDVAIESGFYDQSHMNRVFRRVMARTPGQYRTLLDRAMNTRPRSESSNTQPALAS